MAAQQKKCCNFLINNPVRAFRNAIAHSNWCYKDDYSGIRFWAKKGAEKDEPMVEWEVNQEELSFWQALARCDGTITIRGRCQYRQDMIIYLNAQASKT